MNFEKLISTILNTNSHLQQSAVKAVNTHITLRNWLIGFYIVEYKQNGDDRAIYGTKLLFHLANHLATKNLKNVNERELRNFRTFYKTYNYFSKNLATFPLYSLIASNLYNLPIWGSLTPELQNANNQDDEHYFTNALMKISYTHLVELIKIKETNKRRFYELLTIKNTLSVRELERQIATLTYERMGLSQNTELAFAELEAKLTPANPTDAIKSVYFFDFLDLPNTHLIEESDLEEALIDHLEKFILELGNGFCFEARQKRMLIDDEYYFVDLVFYHRILKCHILIDLKIDKFKHEHLSQLNSYVGYYKDQVKQADDNVPVGILLCTKKGKKMVEYALAGMEKKLFVSKYLLQLPAKEMLESFITNELRKL